MSTFQRCGKDVNTMATKLVKEFESHASLIENKVKIDFVFAYGERDEASGELKSHALKKNGVQALGITRKIPLKQRALGRGDAEICLDGDWWEDARPEQRRALLDHELHHLVATGDTDDLDRPIIKLRKHDYEFGWFNVIAQRHGQASIERQQAAQMMDKAGQYYWPALTEARELRFANLELAQS